MPETKTYVGECIECGSEKCVHTVENYQVIYSCPDCGFEGHDCFEDLCGCMSVPWGFNL